MKRLPALLCAALLSACSASKDATQTGETAATPTPSASASTEPKAEARKVEVNNDLMDFTYSYPAEAAAIPALKSWLDADLAKQQEDTRQGTLEERKSAKEGGYEPRVYSHSTEWKVVTEIPGWLSLSADRYEFTGGAVLGFFFVDAADAPTEAEYLKATWLEIEVDDPAAWKARLQAFGVREVEFPDPTRFFFQAPGGPVFRLAAMDGGL